MSVPAISVECLSKRYLIGSAHATYGSLRDSLATAAGLAFSRFTGRKKAGPGGQSVWALRDVSLTLQQGEIVGVIGSNGAGKSTLLKILSRITLPTSGRVRLMGRVGSLLEVGTGFHPELTGRENVYLSGAILGMTRREIRRQLDRIIAFAEIERYVDTPVKRYSSGMYLRLAFAVAAHLESEILLVDEVLAVGDAAFQRKCMGSMASATASGRTVVFVSHNLGAIRALCKRACLIANGRLLQDSDPAAVVGHYLKHWVGGSSDEAGEVLWSDPHHQPVGSGEVSLRGLRLVGASGGPQSTFGADEPIRLEIDHEVRAPLRGARLNLWILTPEGEIAFVSTDHNRRNELDAPGLYRSVCTIPGRLLNRSRYLVAIDCDIPSLGKELLPREQYLSFTVLGAGNHGSMMTESWPGVVCPQLDWRVDAVSDIDGQFRAERVCVP